MKRKDLDHKTGEECKGQQVQTGWPKQEKIIPPVAADTITTTRSEISLQKFNISRYHSINIASY